MIDHHVEFLCKKIHHCIISWKTELFWSHIDYLFFMSVTQSIMLDCRVACLSILSVKNKTKLHDQIKICSKIIGTVSSGGSPIITVWSGCPEIFPVSSHALNREYQPLPPNRHYRVSSFRQNKFKNYFYISPSYSQTNWAKTKYESRVMKSAQLVMYEICNRPCIILYAMMRSVSAHLCTMWCQ